MTCMPICRNRDNSTCRLWRILSSNPDWTSDGIFDTPPNPRCTWTRPAGTTKYALYVYTNAKLSVVKFANYVTPTCNASTCSYTPTLNRAVGGYKWAVRAWNTLKWSAYSAWRTFTVSN
ncbi:MAG: hypothetical protein MUO64_11215 [Anaerolineales bacterium]|nr:hypothetical protein [Anaerolineales bacterium]